MEEIKSMKLWKKGRRTAFVICLFFSMKGDAQPVAHLPAENAYLTAGAYSVHFMDAFSFMTNAASLAAVKTPMTGMLAERKWMLKELDCYALSSVFCLGKSAMGILFQRSGDADYSEQMAALAYGKNLGKLDIGIRFGCLKESLNIYPGPAFGYSAVGLRTQVTDNLSAGWELTLPVFGITGKTNPEKAPQAFRMGFGYEWGTDLFLALQITKQSGIPVNLTGSISYRYGDRFFFSFGINSSEGSVVFVSGWGKNQLSIQMYTSYEPVLGFSPGLVILWKGKNKKG